jgi:hypothetical protein
MVQWVEGVIMPVFTGVVFFCLVTWIGYMIYWGFNYLGLSEPFVKSRLIRKYKEGFEIDEKTVDFCKRAVIRNWRFRDINRYAKVQLNKDEILYTYFLMKELKGGKRKK